MAEDDERFMTTRQAAQLLGVTQPTIQEWAARGHLLVWKTPGGHRRIARDSVAALLAEQQRAISGKITVLVVDDDPAMLLLYRRQLANLPIRLESAVDGFEGLIMAGLLRPEVILTDLLMPAMDGFRMIHKLLEHPETRHVLMLAVTAMHQGEITGRIPERVVVMQKPPPFDRIRSHILEVIHERQGLGQQFFRENGP